MKRSGPILSQMYIETFSRPLTAIPVPDIDFWLHSQMNNLEEGDIKKRIKKGRHMLGQK